VKVASQNAIDNGSSFIASLDGMATKRNNSVCCSKAQKANAIKTMQLYFLVLLFFPLHFSTYF
jgi:hypothetical protein